MQVALLISGYLLILILVSLSLIHSYWAFGGRWGIDAVMPEFNGVKVLKPGLFGALVVAMGLLVFAFIVAGSAGLLDIASFRPIFDYGIWLIFVIFSARGIGEFNYVGLFKKVNDTRFAYWDSRLYSPLCLFMACLAFLVAIV